MYTLWQGGLRRGRLTMGDAWPSPDDTGGGVLAGGLHQSIDGAGHASSAKTIINIYHTKSRDTAVEHSQ